MAQKNLVLLQTQRKPSQLVELINLITEKIVRKDENYSSKLRKYYFCTINQVFRVMNFNTSLKTTDSNYLYQTIIILDRYYNYIIEVVYLYER